MGRGVAERHKVEPLCSRGCEQRTRRQHTLGRPGAGGIEHAPPRQQPARQRHRRVRCGLRPGERLQRCCGKESPSVAHIGCTCEIRPRHALQRDALGRIQPPGQPQRSAVAIAIAERVGQQTVGVEQHDFVAAVVQREITSRQQFIAHQCGYTGVAWLELRVGGYVPAGGKTCACARHHIGATGGNLRALGQPGQRFGVAWVRGVAQLPTRQPHALVAGIDEHHVLVIAAAVGNFINLDGRRGGACARSWPRCCQRCGRGRQWRCRRGGRRGRRWRTRAAPIARRAWPGLNGVAPCVVVHALEAAPRQGYTPRDIVHKRTTGGAQRKAAPLIG